jgi:hypothetical protein
MTNKFPQKNRLDKERVRKMFKKMVAVAICVASFAMSAAAQVTGSGTSGTVPVFTGTSTVGNSPISVSGSNVGIGTTGPTSQLTVSNSASAKLMLTGGASQNGILLDADSSADQFYIGAGNNLLVPGDKGFIIYDPTANTAKFYVNGAGNVSIPTGNVGIGTTNPATTLDVNGLATFGSATSRLSMGSDSLAFNRYIATGQIYNSGEFAYQFQHTGSTTQGSDFLGLQVYGGAGNNITSYAWVVNGYGNVGIGTTAPAYTLDVAGKVHSSTGYVFPDGTTQTTAFVPANCGADYAESVDVTGDRTTYEPGDILVIDPDAPGKFLKSNQAYSTLVAGIYSTTPGFVGRLHPEDAETDKTEVPMAMVGRVPTKVTAENGPIKVGDLLVASSTLGRAMKGTDRTQMLGAVIGKALGSLDSGTGVIEVLVTLQ